MKIQVSQERSRHIYSEGLHRTTKLQSKSYNHTNRMKERPVWCMIKKLNERKKVLDKIHPSSDVQNIMANKILSYIEVICHNKIAYYSTGTNYSYPYPLFIQHTIDSDMEEWGADEQTWRTMLLSY